MGRTRRSDSSHTLRVRIRPDTAKQIEKFRADHQREYSRWRFTTSDAVRLLILRGLGADVTHP